MTKVVLDTNVLVSALWKVPSKPASIIDLVIIGKITPCFNSEILYEYKRVLNYPKLKFSPTDTANLLDLIYKDGLSFSSRVSSILFTDETDRKFYDVAKEANAYLITGNLKHYPDEPFIVTPTDFLRLIES